MKDIRIGNDIYVVWSLYRDGQPFDLSSLNLTLYLKGTFGKTEIEDFVVYGNEIRWTFYGKDQNQAGKYSLVLVSNEGKQGMMTTDVCDFVRLVHCSCQVDGKDDAGLKTETIMLTSDLAVESVSMVVDEFLSPTSTNPVQNKVITETFIKLSESNEPYICPFDLTEYAGIGLGNEAPVDITAAEISSLKEAIRSKRRLFVPDYSGEFLEADGKIQVDEEAEGVYVTVFENTGSYFLFEIYDSYSTCYHEAFQDRLISGSNIKTIEGSSILGFGDFKIPTDSSLSTTSTRPLQNKVVNAELNKKVSKVSGKGLSTNDYTNTDKAKVSKIDEIEAKFEGLENYVDNVSDQANELERDKQDKLVSGENIKTINGRSILGSGDIVIEGGDSSEIRAELTELSGEITQITTINDMLTSRFYDLSSIELGNTYNGKLGSSAVFTCIKCEVKAGEKYRITTYANTSSAKAYCVVDSNNVVVQLQESAVVDFEVTSIVDGILYVNSWATGYPPMQVKKLENKFSKLESQIEDISSNVVELQKSKGKASLSTSVEVRFVGQYRNASGNISTNAALSISSPIHLVSGASVYFKTRSGLASISALSLVTSDGTYIKTLHTGNEGEIQYIALEDCYVEVCDYNETFSEKSITILYSELSVTLATMATKQSLLDVNAKVANNKSLIRKSTMLEHLCNPFIKTTIHLFGDSITQGQGSSDFSATGEPIPNFTSIKRNVGKKSYAALFAAQVKRLYNRLVWTSVYSDANINKDVGLVTNEGNFQVNNINDVTFIQFKFTGTQFSVITQQYAFGGIFKVYVDNQVKQTIDTYGSGTYLTTEIKGLSDAEHIVEFVATGTKSHSSSVNVLRVAAIGLNKQVEIINDGIIGHQSTSTNGVVYQNATENDNFIIWMSGTNDRTNGAWKTENSISGLMTIVPQKNPNAELIIMSASPCGNGEFENSVYLSHMDEINASLTKIARKYDLCFISHYNYLTRYCREQQQSVSLICSDGVHPNDLGHMLIYQNLCAELNISADSAF